MKWTIKVINAMLLFGILTICFSCKGQNLKEAKRNPLENKKVASPIGETVSKMDHSATLLFQDNNNTYWFGSEEGIYKHGQKNSFIIL